MRSQTDNRAGIPRTLHRISAIRNRRGDIVGLTCRIGRAVFGTIEIIRDLVETGKSPLLLGSPGVGKTTLLRDVARVLADELNKRVVVVDTSNEIAGDGDIPHAGIGRARRMQVPSSTDQHKVMIEAIENHMPEVIVIDEIGTELEAAAARTIAERGVQLVGTAHGNTLTNLMQNPTLSDLIGGIQSVTLSDEEARRRRSQKSVLERKAPPTFQFLVEIKGWHHMIVHHDIAETIDSLLRGRPIAVEERVRGHDNSIESTKHTLRPRRAFARKNFGILRKAKPGSNEGGPIQTIMVGLACLKSQLIPNHWTEEANEEAPQRDPVSIFPFGVSRRRLEDAARNLAVPAWVTEDLDAAERGSDAQKLLPSAHRSPAPSGGEGNSYLRAKKQCTVSDKPEPCQHLRSQHSPLDGRERRPSPCRGGSAGNLAHVATG